MLRLSLFNRAQKMSSSDNEGKRGERAVSDIDGGTDGDFRGDVGSEGGTQGEAEASESEAVEEGKETQEKEQVSSTGSGDVTPQNTQESSKPCVWSNNIIYTIHFLSG